MIHTDASTIPVSSIVYVTWENEPGAPEGSVEFPGNGYGAYGVVVEPPQGALWAVDVASDKLVTNLTNESEVKYVVGAQDVVENPTDDPEIAFTVTDTDGDTLDLLLGTGDADVVLQSNVKGEYPVEIFLDLGGIDELIGALIAVRDQLTATEVDESTAGDPPRPEGLSLAVGGCCGGSCSR